MYLHTYCINHLTFSISYGLQIIVYKYLASSKQINIALIVLRITHLFLQFELVPKVWVCLGDISREEALNMIHWQVRKTTRAHF